MKAPINLKETAKEFSLSLALFIGSVERLTSGAHIQRSGRGRPSSIQAFYTTTFLSFILKPFLLLNGEFTVYNNWAENMNFSQTDWFVSFEGAFGNLGVAI